LSLLVGALYQMSFSMPNSLKRPAAPATVDSAAAGADAHSAKRHKGGAEQLVDSDDEQGKPMCKYGLGCYQTNPEHRKRFRHGAAGSDSTPSKVSKVSKQSHDIDMDDAAAAVADEQRQSAASSSSSSATNRTIAMPSISTNTFQFEVDRAAKIACNVVSEFLKEHPEPDIRIAMVDISDSDALKAMRKVRFSSKKTRASFR
jgi:hypothetical protein